MASQKIRIKLSAYDHELVDQAAQRIVETMQKGGAKISGPSSAARTSIRIRASSSSCAPTSASSTSIPPTPSCWIPSTSPPASTSR